MKCKNKIEEYRVYSIGVMEVILLNKNILSRFISVITIVTQI